MSTRYFPPAAFLLVLALGAAPLSGSSHSKAAVAVPTQRIQVGPLGYRPPGSLYLLSERVFSTLDFIDADHLLFSFHQSRLLRREPKEGGKHSDQIIQALTLRLPEGTVQSSAEWHMHDRDRYLWPLGDGRFLVRQGDAYQLTDATLQLKPWVQVATPILATEGSPDGHILGIEHAFERHTPDEHERMAAQADKFGDAPPSEDTEITMLDTASRKVVGDLRTESPIHLPVTSDGYVGIVRAKGEDSYAVTFYPFTGKPLLLGKVSSSCTPHENFVNARALMIESCGPKSADTYLDVWTTEGKKLWNGMREGHYVWPTFAYATNGDRFAVGLLHVSHTINLADSLNDEDVREQVIQVSDARTGALLFSTTASPILTAGHNFALSPDGKRLAVLRQGAIEIYEVPSEAPAAPLETRKKGKR